MRSVCIVDITSAGSATNRLDEVDQKIIELLEADARQSARALAREIGSPDLHRVPVGRADRRATSEDVADLELTMTTQNGGVAIRGSATFAL